MASLYDSASLVMIPSGVKEDKLYSIKPTDGSGDFTFSRGSDIQATRVNSSGLIEKGRENEVLLSNAFTGSTWVQANVSQTTGFSDPFGGNNASKFLETTANDQHRFYNSFATNNHSVYTQSVYIQPIGRDQIAYGCQSNGLQFIYEFSTETFVSTLGSMIDYGVTSVGSGWYRLHITFSVGGAFNHSFVQGALGGSTSYVGDVTKGFYAYGSQLEAGLVATDYIDTQGSIVTAGITADLPRLDYSGGASCPSLLLEPSRTNLVPNSEYFGDSSWTTTAATTEVGFLSPEGNLNAYKIAEDNTNSIHRIFQTSAITASPNATISVYAKYNGRRFVLMRIADSSVGRWYDLIDGVKGDAFGGAPNDSTIEPVGNDWYRITISHSVSSVARFELWVSDTESISAYQGDVTKGVYLYGAQMEVGNYATSYIPTYGTAANRGHEISTKTGIADLIGQTEGTLYWEGSLTAGENDDVFFIGDYTDTIAITKLNDNRLRFYIRQNGVQTLLTSSAVSGMDENVKIAIAYKSGDIAAYANGNQLLTSALSLSFSAPIPNATLALTAYWLNKAKRSAKQALVFKTRLTNAELAALTTI